MQSSEIYIQLLLQMQTFLLWWKRRKADALPVGALLFTRCLRPDVRSVQCCWSRKSQTLFIPFAKCFRKTASVRQLHKRRLMSHRIGHGDGSGPDCQRPSSTSYNRKLTRKSIPAPTVLHPHATEIRALGIYSIFCVLIGRKFTIISLSILYFVSFPRTMVRDW